MFSASIACFSYIPLSTLSKVLFVEASNRMQTWFFPQRMNNAIMLWALLNGIIGFLLFYGSYHFFGKKYGILPEMLGMSITKKKLLKTVLLGLIIFFSYFMFLNVIYYLLLCSIMHYYHHVLLLIMYCVLLLLLFIMYWY